MRPTIVTILVTLALCSVFPATAPAFWWGGAGENRSGLNLESGYDVNTVTTVTGKVVALQGGDDRQHVQMELESGGERLIVILGPQQFLAEKNVACKVGDEITVRGSKAQGKDGVVYVVAQQIQIGTTNRDAQVTLRSESGRPLWSGGGTGGSSLRMNNRPAQVRQQSPGRLGGGRMGR